MGRRLWVSLVLTATLLAGCGRVVMFGHVVREGSAPEVPADEAASSDPAGTSSRNAPANGGEPVDASASTPPAAASSAGKSNRATADSRVATQAPVLKAVNIRVAPKATENVASETPFEPNVLLEAIRAELRKRKLLDEQDPQVAGTAEVQVDEVAVRPSTNAIVFGYKMMAGTLIGDIHLSGAADTGQPLHVSAESRLTLSAEGENKNPLGPLYRRFAELTADRLAGVESRPDDAVNGGPARF